MHLNIVNSLQHTLRLLLLNLLVCVERSDQITDRRAQVRTFTFHLFHSKSTSTFQRPDRSRSTARRQIALITHID